MISKLSIIAGCRNERSYVKDLFFTRPFKVANVGQYKRDGGLHLMIMSSSPGLLDGDEYDISVKVETEAGLQLQSQAYQRLFNMQEGASQKIDITLSRGSAFSYVPHPVVPHTNSKFRSRTVVHLQDDCKLLIGEIITCGRKHHGEKFKFSYLQSIIEVYHHKKLVLKDRVWLCPEEGTLHTIGQLEGYTHQGSLVYLSSGKESASHYIDPIHNLLEHEEDIAFGISEPESNGFVLRILGNGGEQLFRCFKKVEEKLWEENHEFVEVKNSETVLP